MVFEDTSGWLGGQQAKYSVLTWSSTQNREIKASQNHWWTEGRLRLQLVLTYERGRARMVFSHAKALRRKDDC